MRNKRKICFFVLILFIMLSLSLKSYGQKTKIKVMVDKAKIYLEPDLTSNVITHVPLGAVFEVESTSGDFYAVNLPPDKNGFVVEPLDLEDLFQKTKLILDDEKLANEMGQKGRELTQKYDINVVGENLVNLYKEFL